MLTAAQERILELEAHLGQLQTRLSYEQSQQWNTKRDNERLAHENHRLREQWEAQVNEARRLEDLLRQEEKSHDRLEEKYRDLKRRSRSRTRSESSEYRSAYDAKVREVELLRVRLAEKEHTISLDQARLHSKDQALKEKNTTIQYLKDYLNTHGFRVAD